MYIIGLFFALLIGIVLGLVGGGGSILTVPLVNYYFDVNMLIATTYSLFVVAVASSFGVLQRLKSKQIDFKQGIIFVIPSMIVAFAIRRWIMPMFPIQFALSDFELSREIVITTLLIIVMIYTASKTLFSKRRSVEPEKTNFVAIIFFGILTGLLSGFIGAGGGFIIVPILLRLGLDMKKAVGTSMFIISIQSGVALIGDSYNEEIISAGIDWKLLSALTVITVGGVFMGGFFQKKVSSEFLRKVFSLVLLVVAGGLIYKMVF
ncbi:MAG: sulfite exporter TauE/SafE family protein [Crocinitomicaceae bacterium]|nr:sulfite exporter TauE/SafE family protein [Crocinitomicaceae bacterium]